MERIAVIGAGAMGKQIALQSALNGFDVSLNDSRIEALQQARSFVDEYLDGRIAKERITPERKEAALAALHFTPELDVAVKDASIVIEAIIEHREPKLVLFRELDRVCHPQTILATNSSNICGSQLAEVTKRPSRVLNLHFFNPALVMELVEVVAHPAVPTDVIEAVVDFCRRIGKRPILIRKEIPGFVVNRIFRALTREALALYEGGFASVEDIDLAVTKGLGHPMGPFRLMDLAGVDITYLARKDEYEQTGVETAKPNSTLEEMYRRGEWGRKSGKGFYRYAPDAAR